MIIFKIAIIFAGIMFIEPIVEYPTLDSCKEAINDIRLSAHNIQAFCISQNKRE